MSMNIRPTIEELLSGQKCLEYLQWQIEHQKISNDMQKLGRKVALIAVKAFQGEMRNILVSCLNGENRFAEQAVIFRIISIESCEVMYIGCCSYHLLEQHIRKISEKISEDCIFQYTEMATDKAECIAQNLVSYYQPALNTKKCCKSVDIPVSVQWEHYTLPEKNWNCLTEKAPAHSANGRTKSSYIRQLENCLRLETRIRFYGGYDEIVKKTEEKYQKSEVA